MNEHNSFPTDLRQGACFRYTVPAGWQVQEDGAYAVVLVAPDRCALTILVGNAGVPTGTPPAAFIGQYLGPQCPQLALSEPRPAASALGAPHAWEFDYQYQIGGVPCYGRVKCHLWPSYDCSTMVLTAAAAQASQWPQYATWLPGVPEQVQVTHPQAFGAQGIQQQNLYNSQQLGQAYQSYRSWSEQTWAEVAQQRAEQQERQNFQFRENLGAVQTYFDPYRNQLIELPPTYRYHWVTPQGQLWSTDDPSDDPNRGSTQTWTRMQRYTPR